MWAFSQVSKHAMIRVETDLIRHRGRICPYFMWGRTCPYTDGGGRGAADPRVGANVTRPRFAWQAQ